MLSQGSRPLILVIDATPYEMQPVLGILRAQSFRLSVAQGGQQGYYRALALRPDLILLDVCMPQMDGFTICRLLREAPSTRDVPIIFLSTNNSLEERLEGLTMGVDYLQKPCAPEEVLARVRIHLQLAWRDDQQSEPIETLDRDQLILRASLRLINQQLDDLPSLSEIASKVGTHEKKLSAIFRRHLGGSVFEYIREQRLNKAQELLKNSTLGMQDIAELIGFRSACNFTTAFRKRVGVTPSQFRRSHWADKK